jgi:ElaB/YqjD/DUF883 family membrane-anchored ribosome-binding protein
VAELGEVVAEAAEEVASGALNVAAASRSFPVGAFVGGIVIGAGIGFAVGFLVAKKRLDEKYRLEAEEEIDAVRDHFRKRLLAKEDKPAPGDLAETTQELGYSSPVGPRPGEPEADPTAIEPRPPVPVPPREHTPNKIHQALEEAQDRAEVTEDDFITDAQHWIAAEAPKRDHAIPYVIHFDERGEADFDTVTYNYYAGDDVLCDEAENPLQGRDTIVGDHNLDKFGYGSGDPNVVYIRNDNLALEMEIVRDPGTFEEEVHGIKHSDGEPRRRWRTPDEEA